MSTNSLPSGGPARDVTEWYRKRYRGVVAAERRGDQVLVLIDEGNSYSVNRQILAFPDTDREVLIRCWVDHVPKSRIDPTRLLYGQWVRGPGAWATADRPPHEGGCSNG